MFTLLVKIRETDTQSGSTTTRLRTDFVQFSDQRLADSALLNLQSLIKQHQKTNNGVYEVKALY